jgi:chromosome segregation ATPase
MNIEENKSRIHTVAERRTQSPSPQHQPELESTANEITQFYQQITKDLGPRQANFEESFRMVVELLRVQEARIDGNDDAHSEIDTRLNFLLSSQSLLGEKVDKLTNEIAAIGSRFDQMAARVNQVTSNVDLLTSNIATINRRVDWITDRLDRIGEYLEMHCQHHVQIDERHDRMSERAEAHDQHITRIDERLDRIGVYVQAHTQYLTQIDKRLDRMSEHAEGHDKQLTQILEHIEVHSRQLSKIDERFSLLANMQVENAERIKWTDNQIREIVTAQKPIVRKTKTNAIKKAGRSSKR